MTSPGIHKQDAYDVQRMNIISKAMGNFDNIVSVCSCVRVCVRAGAQVVSFMYYTLTTVHTFVYLSVYLSVCLVGCLFVCVFDLKRKFEDNGIF